MILYFFLFYIAGFNCLFITVEQVAACKLSKQEKIGTSTFSDQD